ncbi:MAG: globin domain-containing protein [Phycisphaerales bacterium]
MPVRKHPVAVLRHNDPLPGLPVDAALASRLRSTYDRVRADGPRLAEIFYARLFAAAPHLRPLFSADPAAQAHKLMSALDAVVANLERPAENHAILAALGRRHAEYGARPEHYHLVIDLIVDSMRALLGPRATDRDLHEWRTALRLISNQMLAAAAAAPETQSSPAPAISLRRALDS